jgi:hypothetical protein
MQVLRIASTPGSSVSRRLRARGARGTRRRVVRRGRAEGPSVTGWRDDGRELYFIAGNGTSVMSCEVRSVPTLEVGMPHRWFELPQDQRGAVSAPHGDKFLVLLPRETSVDTRCPNHAY